MHLLRIGEREGEEQRSAIIKNYQYWQFFSYLCPEGLRINPRRYFCIIVTSCKNRLIRI
jgi:hypothetical protein